MSRPRRIREVCWSRVLLKVKALTARTKENEERSVLLWQITYVKVIDKDSRHFYVTITIEVTSKKVPWGYPGGCRREILVETKSHRLSRGFSSARRMHVVFLCERSLGFPGENFSMVSLEVVKGFGAFLFEANEGVTDSASFQLFAFSPLLAFRSIIAILPALLLNKATCECKDKKATAATSKVRKVRVFVLNQGCCLSMGSGKALITQVA
uniref:Uncharacterized protein n=1 Tax=Cannabis sativa TaxID=3483 RepID=A0A803P0U6_CANSA